MKAAFMSANSSLISFRISSTTSMRRRALSVEDEVEETTMKAPTPTSASSQLRPQRALAAFVDETFYLKSDYTSSNFLQPIDMIALLNTDKQSEVIKRLEYFD